MSYIFELQTSAGDAGYVVANGETREEALAQLNQQLGMDDEHEVVVLAVHTVH